MTQKQTNKERKKRSKPYAGEDQRTQRGVHDVQDSVTDEDAEDPEDEEDDHTHEQDAGTGSEVVFTLSL